MFTIGYCVHSFVWSSFFHVRIYEFENNFRHVIQQLSTENYDLIVDLHKSLRSYIFRLLLFKRVISYNKLTFDRWRRTKSVKTLIGDQHIAERFLERLSSIDVYNDNRGLDFFIEGRNKMFLESPNGYKTNVAIVAGAQHFTKCIPLDFIRSLIETNEHVFFFILGGEKERKKGKELEALINVKNYCALLNLQQSASVMDYCDYVISGDTGLMHIAAALKKNTITIWGSTSKEFGFHPYYPPGQGRCINIEVNGLDCRPCGTNGKSSCPRSHFRCMREISTRDVILAMNAFRITNQ